MSTLATLIVGAVLGLALGEIVRGTWREHRSHASNHRRQFRPSPPRLTVIHGGRVDDRKAG